MKHQHHRSKSSSFEKTKQNKHPRRTTNSLELLHLAHKQHFSRQSPTRVRSNRKQTSTNRDEEIEDIKNHINLLKQNQRQHVGKSNLNILRTRKNILDQKASSWHPPQEAILKPASNC